jgi:hypothetical protein
METTLPENKGDAKPVWMIKEIPYSGYRYLPDNKTVSISKTEG